MLRILSVCLGCLCCVSLNLVTVLYQDGGPPRRMGFMLVFVENKRFLKSEKIKEKRLAARANRQEKRCSFDETGRKAKP